MKKKFSPSPIVQRDGLAVIRIIVGVFMIYHGSEVFDASKIQVYATWDIFKKFSSPSFIIYLGKSAELIGGILLATGCFTRIGSLILILTMSFISFFVGNGKIWYDDQYPFLFVLLALVFFFTGPCNWSVDNLILNKKNKIQSSV